MLPFFLTLFPKPVLPDFGGTFALDGVSDAGMHRSGN
jgi:hypothetical protein